MNTGAVIDAFDYLMNFDKSENKDTVDKKSVDEALIESLNRFNRIDIRYISELTGLSPERAVSELRGSIFQLPELQEDSYDVTLGWVISANYLSGNAKQKLKIAEEMNEKFPGRFESNIEALKKILPQTLTIDDIHISLGASWIPEEEYTEFISDFLGFSENVKVLYNKELSTYQIIVPPLHESEDSFLNNVTYGVREDAIRHSNQNYTTYVDESMIKQYLTALNIIEHTMNAKTIKIYDYIPNASKGWRAFEYEPVFNKTKTLEAQDKQKQIIDAFKDWVYASKARSARFEDYYNDAFVGYTYSHYDGSFLKLADLNPIIKLRKHQRNAVARVLLSGLNTLFSHDVGAGKTYEIIVSVHELKRMGISEKNLVVVPNNVLKATVDAHRLLYKDDKILVVYPKDFTPKLRNQTLEQIRDGDYTAIYMAYSSFDLIVMSKSYYIRKMDKQIRELKTASYNAVFKQERKSLQRQAKALAKKLDKYIEEEPVCGWLTFDELGINTLVVDEAHNYKNVPTPSRTDNIVGISTNGSKKCREMLEKSHYVDRLIFATGTPLTNSIADLFTFQTYLQPNVLEYHKIKTFDAWINTFGQRETLIECDVDANSANLRTTTRFSSFHNLNELMALFSQVCDFHHIEQNEQGLPKFNGAINICVPKNRAQAEYFKKLSERTELIRNKEVKRHEDNLLKVTTDGRKAALDIRLTDYNGSLDFDVKTKIDACAEKAYEFYEAYPFTAQIIFCDIGTPKASFNVYNALSERLCELGVKESEIAFIHDAVSESARSRLFSAMNKGLLRIVIGSTQKLGIGVNVQERLIALHHLSVPWRPADMVQREGRILRQGNTCEEVFVFRYVTEGSFDAYSWQLLENKQRFISSFLSGTSATRNIEDIADAVLNFAEVKALAIGNPLIKKRVEVSNMLERTKVRSRSRQKQLQEANAVIEMTPDKIKKLEALAEKAEKDFEFYTSNKESIPKEERISFGEELLDALKENENLVGERLFDEYRGFSVILPSDMTREDPHIFLKSPYGSKYYCEISDGKTPLGCSMTIDHLLDRLDEKAINLRAKADTARKQIAEAEEDLELGNPYLEQIKELKDRLDEIDRLIEKGIKEEKKAC